MTNLVSFGMKLVSIFYNNLETLLKCFSFIFPIFNPIVKAMEQVKRESNINAKMFLVSIHDRPVKISV